MDNPFKIGDRVKTKYSAFPGIYTIRYVQKALHTAGYKYLIEGYPTTFFDSELLFFSAVNTDEELASEYRELRNKAKDIASELRNRGYETQAKVDGGFWVPMAQAPHQYRFVKNITKEI